MFPSTQQSIAIASLKTLTTITTPVSRPPPSHTLIRVSFTASTPLDLHRADGGLLIPSYPALSGSGGISGVVVASDVLQPGDRVMSFAFHGGAEANHQEYVTVPNHLLSKVPENISLEQAVTVPVNLVTVFHTVTKDLELQLPWPKPEGYKPEQRNDGILIWGASSSVGIFAVQVLRHWGFENILAVSSAKHHDYMKKLGATACFDYNDADVIDKINETGKIPFIIDCIGSLKGTLEPLTKIAKDGTTVAVMLPVILKDASETEAPEYEMDASKVLVDKWAKGVVIRGVRTHFYLEVSFCFVPTAFEVGD